MPEFDRTLPEIMHVRVPKGMLRPSPTSRRATGVHDAETDAALAKALIQSIPGLSIESSIR
jgi:hypothetical protein